MSNKPDRYEKFLSLIGSKETRPKVSEEEFQESLMLWREDGQKVLGYPSEKPTLISHLVDEKKFTEDEWRTCWSYAHEKNDIFELNLWIYRTGEESKARKSEAEILKELIEELNECISTIVGMWKGLEKNHKQTIHSGIERLQEAQAKFVELGSDL